MASRFKAATRKQSKLRMALDGPSGSGKTFTSLEFAFAIGKRVAVIDSEHGSASKYVGEKPEWQFDVLELASYSPSEYTAAINDAGASGYEVIVVDGLSHAWEGTDGALELVDKKGGNRFTAWKDVTPMHRRMIDAITMSPAHVICTMRSKTEYVLEADGNGKQVPRKVGMAPVQRPGMEYEFDIYGSLDWSHVLTLSKSRCRAVDGLIVARPSASFMEPVIVWLTSGVATELARPAARVSDEQLQWIIDSAGELGWKVDRLEKELPKRYECLKLSDVNTDQAEDFLKWLEGQKKLAAQRAKKAATQSAPAEHAATAEPTNGNSHASQGSSVVAEPGMITQDRLDKIAFLYRSLTTLAVDPLTPTQYQAALSRRGVHRAGELTQAQADEFIAALQRILLAKNNTEQAAQESLGFGSTPVIGHTEFAKN